MERKSIESICTQFAHVLRGKGKVEDGACTVSFKRQLDISIQGKKSKSVLGVTVSFESLDEHGRALNIAEVPIIDSEIPAFQYAASQQGLIISALHNHWLFTNSPLYYIHIQSVEPPIQFAQKMAYVFSQLHQYPNPKDGA